MAKTYKIVVLNDGETWSDIGGAAVVTLTEEGYEKLQAGYTPDHLSAEYIINVEDLNEMWED